MAIVSMPNNKNFDDNYDKVFCKEEKKECGCTDCVCEAHVKVKFDPKDCKYRATCDKFPDMNILADEPATAFELAEAWLNALRTEVG